VFWKYSSETYLDFNSLPLFINIYLTDFELLMLGLKQLSTLVNTVWNAMLQHILCLSVTQQALASAPWPLKLYKHHEKFTNPRWILVLAFPLVCDVLWHPACTYFFSVIHLVMGNAVYTIQWSVNFLTGLIQLNTPFLSGKGIFICNGCDCASRSSSVLPLSKALHHIYIRCKTCMWCTPPLTGIGSLVQHPSCYNNWITLLCLTFYCVCSRPATSNLIVWWYSTVAVPCHDWQQTLCVCLLQWKICRWLLLFHMSHTLDLFLKLLCCMRSTLVMNPSGFICLWSIVTEILCGIQFFQYKG
jgi:hypothetical protein